MGHNGCDGSQASGPWAIGSGYRFTTTTLTADESGPRPCHAWAHLTNVHIWDRHVVFRDPAVLKVMEPKIDPSVFSQNPKNAGVPSWKRFFKSLSNGQKSLTPFLPDQRQHVRVDLMSNILLACESFYQNTAMQYP